MKLVNWNVQWAAPESARGRAIRRELIRQDPDVVCLTEGTAELLPEGGQALESEVDYGYGVQEKRRKVLLWARGGFAASGNDVSPPGMPPGRLVEGVTQEGHVRILGICIPWSRAHVSTGQRNRRPWEDHIRYLSALRTHLESRNSDRLCILGDFNQTIPRSRAPTEAYQALERAFAGLNLLTAGRRTEPPLIDHIAVSPDATLVSWEGLPVLSDHLGWAAVLRFA